MSAEPDAAPALAVPGELANYREYLDHFRATLRRQCADLTPQQLATRAVPPSDLSLLGMVQHLARVEHHWFQRCLGGRGEEARLFDDGTGGFTDVVGTQAAVDAAWAAYDEQVAAADAVLDGLGDADMAQVRVSPSHPEETPTIRDVLVHLVEEYARHCGHADLLRECLDGRTGL
jgi:uncharacterized damage-inducible protein DinB